jgi:hypothetical protein
MAYELFDISYQEVQHSIGPRIAFWVRSAVAALGRSCGGLSTKIQLPTNAKGGPVTFDVTGGEVHEVKGCDALAELNDVDTESLTAPPFAATWKLPASSVRFRRTTSIDLGSQCIHAAQYGRTLR